MATRPPPILDNKHHDEPAVFKPENLLREARRQRLPAESSRAQNLRPGP